MERDGRIGVLFVCLGNICRSPLAEAVFRALVAREGLQDRFRIDSAGTSNYHEGESPDPRTVQVARNRGVEVGHSARQVRPDDFDTFDYVLAMDRENLRRLERVRERNGGGAEPRLLRSFDGDADAHAEVPDPYFGGDGGFEKVQDMVERACEGLLAHVREAHGI